MAETRVYRENTDSSSLTTTGTARTSASDLITEPNPRGPVGEKLGRN